MPAPSQVSMRKFGDYGATRTAIYDNSLAAVQALPPVENSRYRLELGNVGYAGNPTFSTADHKQAMIQGTSMARRITGMYKLIDKASGNVVDSKQTTVAAVPYLTNQGTFVTDGTTSALSHQTRLLPGVYARVRANGVAESHVNLLPGTGVPHRINLDPETGVFKMTVGQAEIPAINLLKTLGATDDDMAAAWGRDLMAVNKKYDKPHYVEKLYEKFGPAGKRPDGLDVSAAVAERVSKYPLDPWVMQRTLGAPYEKYGKDVLLATTKKLLNIAHGKAEPDDRDNPSFATVWGPEHLIPERLSRVGPVMSKILWQVTNSGSLKKLPTGVLTPAVRSVFTKSGLAQVPEGTSSLEFMDHGARLTKIGEGGIGKSAESIPDSARWVSSSQLPFIDPIRTSECFDPETQVMTERGWKPWPEVTADDLFACVVDGRLCFHKAIKLYDHEYTGTMYGAKNLYIDYLVTPNHRFYVTTVDTIARQQWRWVTADQVHNKSRMHRSSGFEPYAGDDKFTHFVLPEVEAFVPELPDQSEGSSRRTIGVRRLGVKEAMPIEPFCEFMGWYLAEGSLRAPDLGKTKAYQVVISQSETANPTKCDAIRKCLADLNITGFYAPSTNGFIFCGKQWVKYLLQFGFCDGKFIPEELFQAPPSARKRLFDSLLAGDGTTNQYGRIESLSTTSPRLAKDFARLAFSLGYSTSTSVFPDDRQARYLDNYRVTWHTRQQRLVRPEVNRLGKVRPGDYYTQEYSGKVYCATVPGGMLYVKRGDTPGFWSGNSDTIGVDLRTAFGTRLGSDKQIYAPLRDARTGKLVFKSPRDLADATVAFPDAHKSLEPMVPVVQGGKMTYAPKHAIDYIIPSMEQTFSPLTNLVPIKSASKPHRASMGARMSVSGGTVIVVARMDGTVYRGSIAEYQWMQGDKACSIDKESCEIVWKPVRGKITHDNVKRMYLVTFKSGRSVEATHDHSFVTMGHDGRLVKTHTQNLDRATVVPVAGRFNPPASEVRTWVVPDGIKHNSYPSMSFPLDYETGWVHGIYLSEGHLTLREAGHRNAGDVAFSTFANLEPAVYNRVADFFDSRGVKGKLVSGRSDGKIDRVVVAWRQLGEKLGIDFGNGSYEKAIPAWVLCAPEEYRKGLIGGYMAGDGTVVGRRSTMRAAAGSRSVMLRDGLCDVMLTLGIDASRSVTMVDTGPGGSTVPQYRFEIRAEHLDRVPLMGHPVKDTRMSEASWSGKRSADFFPVYADLRKILNKMLKRGSTFYNRVRSNKMIRQVATATLGIAGDTRAHRWLRSEVRWDKVDSVQEIDAAAYQQVYDLDLEDNVFMVNGGLFVHNTTQALPLVDVEAPLVRTEVPNQPGKSFEELFGRHIGAVHHRPDGPGLVTEVGPDHIKVRGHDGVEQVHEIYNNLPAGRKSGLHQDVLVKPGDVVGPGQLLAKSNYVDKNGHAAYGANLRVAFMAMKGSVLPDTKVLWYDASGCPRYTDIACVPDNASAGLSLDVDDLTVSPSPLVKVWSHPADDIVEVKTDSGRVVRATTNHSFVVLDDDLRVVEVPASALSARASIVPRAGYIDLPVTSDTVVVPRTARKECVELALNFNLGFLLGLYVAEGCKVHNSASFSVGDVDLRGQLMEIAGELFPDTTVSVDVQVRKQKSGRDGTSTAVNVYDVRLALWLEAVCGKGAQNKRVPDFIFGAPVECRHGFLSGYWAGDGRVHAKKDVPTDTDVMLTSRTLRDGLGLLMASLGIATTHSEYLDDAYTDGVVYRLGVACRDTAKFRPFKHSVKWDRLSRIAASYKNDGTGDAIPVTAAVRRRLRTLARQESGSRSPLYHRLSVSSNQAVRRVARRDVIHLTKDAIDPVLIRLRKIAESTLEWDVVESINKIEYSGDVYDLDMGNRRTFVCIDTLVVHNSVYEDSMLISQSAANNKLKSDHLYRHDLEPDDTIKIGRAAHTSAFPGLHSLEKLKTVDDDGVVKPGTTVNKGDPLILAVKQKVGQYGRLSRSGKSGMADASEVWDHDEPGVVTDVHRTKNGPVVLVKSQKPAQSGDKISGRHGNKGVTNVLPDHEMPVDEQGRPVDMVISSLGTISRANPSAIFEAYLGKIAEKTGKPYVVPDFQHDQDIGKFVQGEGDKHGVKFLETLTDPKTGRPIPNVGVGNMYVMKLSHMASGKVKGRGLGGYDETGQPLRGQSGKAMRSSMGDSNALLSHGATSVIADAHNYKGQANDNFWVQYMSGYPAPRPVVSKAFDRFLTELKAAGIHPVREGSRYHLKAMTDKTINEMAGDRVVDNGETLDFSRNGEPYKGGLFDPATFGSSDAADRWAKIPLHEPVLNPVFEEPTRRLLGLTEDKFRNVIAGKDSLPTGTGHKAIVDALRAYDVPKELAKVRLAADSNRKTVRDEAYRKLGYLKHMAATKGSPADWVVSSVPVLPPAFRPVSQGPSGVVVNDQNMVYKDLLEANSALKDLHGVVADTGAERLNVYDAVKAAFGLGAPVSAKNQERQVKGVLERLLGQTSKYSYVQQKLLGTPVDLSGRGQVLPSPDLDLDQIGIPESMAWDVYHPFVVRRLVRAGVPRVEAARLVADKADRAKSAMIDEMGERPALATRYPALHRYNTMAFHPKLVKGDAIQTNSLINKGYNLDHDGDAMTISIPLSEDAVKEAYAKLLPSKNLFSPATMKATSYLPNMEYIAGLHAASTMDENNPHVTFKTKAEAISAYRAGHIGMGTRVRILEGEK